MFKKGISFSALCLLALNGLQVFAEEAAPATGEAIRKNLWVAILIVALLLIVAVVLLSVLGKKKKLPSQQEQKEEPNEPMDQEDETAPIPAAPAGTEEAQTNDDKQ